MDWWHLAGIIPLTYLLIGIAMARDHFRDVRYCLTYLREHDHEGGGEEWCRCVQVIREGQG